MKKVALYVRVSTDKQEAKNQLIDLRAYCKKKGYEIFKEYVDVISGSKQSRPGFNNLFEDAHEFLFDIVLFWDLSRFSRSGTLYTLQKLKELENIGIDWKSYKEKYFDSAGQFKDVILSIISTLAKMEKERISERTKAGLRTAKLSGKTLGRPGLSKDKIKEVKRVYGINGSIRLTAKLTKISYSACWNVLKGGRS